ncbi:hypothetical protein B0J11DRAFT_326944 [Dendryphion nanum]|uniref:Uncharacterized protein n=1 Tax=Dendryphion nanum TaxID=256645 RepID=A0A9P9DS11_9PLEO|nr:hypothetical protein B0J11DRAFT_326944 [Dendryphion nanum]
MRVYFLWFSSSNFISLLLSCLNSTFAISFCADDKRPDQMYTNALSLQLPALVFLTTTWACRGLEDTLPRIVHDLSVSPRFPYSLQFHTLSLPRTTTVSPTDATFSAPSSTWSFSSLAHEATTTSVALNNVATLTVSTLSPCHIPEHLASGTNNAVSTLTQAIEDAMFDFTTSTHSTQPGYALPTALIGIGGSITSQTIRVPTGSSALGAMVLSTSKLPANLVPAENSAYPATSASTTILDVEHTLLISSRQFSIVSSGIPTSETCTSTTMGATATPIISISTITEPTQASISHILPVHQDYSYFHQLNKTRTIVLIVFGAHFGGGMLIGAFVWWFLWYKKKASPNTNPLEIPAESITTVQTERGDQVSEDTVGITNTPGMKEMVMMKEKKVMRREVWDEPMGQPGAVWSMWNRP